MQGRVSAAAAFGRVPQDDESTSASCAEEAPHAREPPRARVAWKAVAAAAVMVLGMVGIAGTALTHDIPEASDQETSLAGVVYNMYGITGCKNWASIEMSRSTVADKTACQALCDADTSCKSFNWQQNACEPGWYVNGGCMLFNGDCQTERNVCWGWNSKPPLNTVQQELVLETEGTPEQTATKVVNALAAQGVPDAIITETAKVPARRLAGRKLVALYLLKLVWLFQSTDGGKTKEVEKFAKDLAETNMARAEFEKALSTSEPTAVQTKKIVQVANPNASFVPPVPGETTTTAAPVTCSGEYDSCLESKCCADPGLYCYQKNDYWAGCRPDCNIGIHVHDPPEHQTPWSCTVLDPDPNTPPPTKGPEPPSNCSSMEESCATTKCCASPTLYCYEKDAYWAGCLTSCTIGINPNDAPQYATPWSCTVLDPDPNTPPPIDPITTSE